MRRPPIGMTTVCTIGAAYSANKGAGSMIQALADELPSAVPGITVEVHTTYPACDQALLERLGEDLTVIDAGPRGLALVQLPLALLAGTLRVARLPWRWLMRHPALRSLADADLVIDITGIAFTDARGARFVVYHLLLDLVPLLLGVPVVKASQALGPFEHKATRTAARLTLPRLRRIVSRGRSSSQNLDRLGVPYDEAADLAFLMKTSDRHRAEAERHLNELGVDGSFLAVSPSSVLRGMAARDGLDYTATVIEITRRVADATDLPIVVFGHSSQATEAAYGETVPERLDDLLVCREVVAALDRSDVLLLDISLGPAELRAVIDRADLVVASRFHAMISALATATPVVVLGWSHKYAEVLDEFGLTGLALDHTSRPAEELAQAILDALARSDDIARTIEERLGAVTASARHNIDVIVEELEAAR